MMSLRPTICPVATTIGSICFRRFSNGTLKLWIRVDLVQYTGTGRLFFNSTSLNKYTLDKGRSGLAQRHRKDSTLRGYLRQTIGTLTVVLFFYRSKNESDDGMCGPKAQGRTRQTAVSGAVSDEMRWPSP